MQCVPSSLFYRVNMSKPDDEILKREIIRIVPEQGLTMAQLPATYKATYKQAIRLKKHQLTTFVQSIKELNVKSHGGHNVVTKTVTGQTKPSMSTVQKPPQEAKSLPPMATKASKLKAGSNTVETMDLAAIATRLSDLHLDDKASGVRFSLTFLFRKSTNASNGGRAQGHLLECGNSEKSGLCLFGTLAPVEDASQQDSATTGSFSGDRYDEDCLDEGDSDSFGEWRVPKNEEQSDAADADQTVYLQTEAPFCAVCIGVQGAGKSHTMNVILENCLMPPLAVDGRVIVGSPQPLSGLVLHFDPSPTSVCESVGLNSLSSEVFPGAFTPPDVVILVSPSFYLQRRDFYQGTTAKVYPLLFEWQTFSATQLRKLMRLSDSDTQLYVSTMLSLLRDYQRENKIPTFESFLLQVEEKCDIKGQSAPLKQRLELLTNFVRESAKNSALIAVGKDLQNLLKSGTLVVADLTDPMMTADEACGVFQVLLEQFRGAPLGGVGKVVAFDEAHKYLSHSGPGCVELSNAIVDSVRLMRHDGLRVLISTQSPTTMPPELLELASVTILHRFQSAEWSRYLSSKVTLPEGSFEQVKALTNGRALLLSTQMSRDLTAGTATSQTECITVDIRPRLTKDLGASQVNRVR